MAKHAKTVAYLRIYTIDRDLEQRRTDILRLANDKGFGTIEWVEENVSGRASWRDRRIGRLIQELGAGDNLVVSEFSRLGRSLLECLEILTEAVDSQLNVFAVKGGVQLDSSTESRIIAKAFTMAAEIERELISQRTKEALATRKREGKPLGRPRGTGKSKLDPYRSEIELLLANGSTQKFIAHRYDTTEANLSRWMKKQGLRKEKAATSSSPD